MNWQQVWGEIMLRGLDGQESVYPLDAFRAKAPLRPKPPEARGRERERVGSGPCRCRTPAHAVADRARLPLLLLWVLAAACAPQRTAVMNSSDRVPSRPATCTIDRAAVCIQCSITLTYTVHAAEYDLLVMDDEPRGFDWPLVEYYPDAGATMVYLGQRWEPGGVRARDRQDAEEVRVFRVPAFTQAVRDQLTNLFLVQWPRWAPRRSFWEEQHVGTGGATPPLPSDIGIEVQYFVVDELPPDQRARLEAERELDPSGPQYVPTSLFGSVGRAMHCTSSLVDVGNYKFETPRADSL